MSKCFFKKKSDVEDDSTSTTEEISVEDEVLQPALDHDFMEIVFRQEVQAWLDINAKALFSLTTNQWLAKQKKAEGGLKVVRK